MDKPRKQAQESHSTQNGHEEQLLSEMGAKKKKGDYDQGSPYRFLPEKEKMD